MRSALRNSFSGIILSIATVLLAARWIFLRGKAAISKSPYQRASGGFSRTLDIWHGLMFKSLALATLLVVLFYMLVYIFDA